MTDDKAPPVEDVARILAQFPGPARLAPVRIWRATAVAATIFALLVPMGAVVIFWSLLEADTAPIAILGLVAIGVGLAFTWYSFASVFNAPSGYALILDAQGFEFGGTRLGTRYRSAWKDADGFKAFSADRRRKGAVSYRYVVFRDAAGPGLRFSGLYIPLPDGCNTYLTDTYGFDARDLLQLMTAWRARALACPPDTAGVDR